MSTHIRFASLLGLLLGSVTMACGSSKDAGAGGAGGAGSGSSSASAGMGGAAMSSSGSGSGSGSASSSGMGGATSTASSGSASSSTASSTSVGSSSAVGSSSSAVGSSSSGGNPNQKPCTHGPGWIAFRFHYQPGPGTQDYLDEFGLPDNSNWQVDPAFATSVVDNVNGGGIEIAGGNWLLIRYSVVGLSQITSATFSIYGRSYNVSASGSFNAWSPLYGDAPSPVNSVSNAWPYAWTTIDYTGHVNVGDSPGLTGIRLYAGPNSNDLAIHAVELCIEGS